MRHISPVEPSRAPHLQSPEPEPRAAAAEPQDLWAGSQPPLGLGDPSAFEGPPLPDAEGPRVPDIEAIRLARGGLWAPPFAWAHAMDVLFDLGVTTLEQFRTLKSMAFTGHQSSQREANKAQVAKVRAERRAAANHLLIGVASAGVGITAGIGRSMGGTGLIPMVADSLGRQAAELTGQMGKYIDESCGKGTYAAKQADLRRSTWDYMGKIDEKTERTCEELLQQNQRAMSALLDMLQQVQQKQSQTVTQISNNV